ncbi:MAG: alpha/beta hydrolase [Patescibacteria group bacterium]
MNNTKNTAAGARYWIYNPKAKKNIVAVHGLRGTHHGLQFIAASLPQYRLIIPDLPGFGQSKPLASVHNEKNYTAWLGKFINDLKLQQPPVLLGHSFGSIVASSFAAKNPKKISQLILINPISEHGNALGGLAAKGYYQLGNLLPESVGTKLLKSRLVTRMMSETMLTSKQKNLRNRVHEQHFAYFATFANRRSVHEAFQATINGSVMHVANKLTMPVLLIVGAKDRFVPLRGQMQLYKNLPNAKMQILPKVGHLIHYETPEKAAEKIAEFIS